MTSLNYKFILKYLQSFGVRVPCLRLEPCYLLQGNMGREALRHQRRHVTALKHRGYIPCCPFWLQLIPPSWLPQFRANVPACIFGCWLWATLCHTITSSVSHVAPFPRARDPIPKLEETSTSFCLERPSHVPIAA